MGPALIKDVRGRARLYKNTQDFRASPRLVIDLRVELSVRKRSRTAFAELDIGGGIEFSCRPIKSDVL